MSPLTALTKFFSGSRSAKPSRRKAPSRRLGVESLEKRQVMAGNVLVIHGNNALNFFGDTQDNQISVIETRPGVVQVASLDNTTINGKSGMFHMFKNPSDNLNINLGAGNDTLWLGKTGGPISTFRNVNAQMGAGLDFVRASGTVTYGNDFSSFNLGDEYQNDVDAIQIEQCNFRALGMGTGGGDDRVYSFNSTISKALVTTGGGQDRVELTNTTSTELHVTMGDGHDWLKFDKVRVDRLTAELGHGHDQVNTWGLNAGSMDVDGGSGTNTYRGPWNSWHPNFRAVNFRYVFDR